MKDKKSRKEAAPAEEAMPVVEEQVTGEPDPRDDEIEKLRKELLYQAAEVENFKRRTENRYRDMVKFAPEPLVKDLLTVLDNLERAVAHAGDAPDAVAEGLNHIINQLREALARHGVSEIEALGMKFDPNFHEALAQMPGEADNIVLTVHEKGYTFQGKLLRPSRVIVSRLA